MDGGRRKEERHTHKDAGQQSDGVGLSPSVSPIPNRVLGTKQGRVGELARKTGERQMIPRGRGGRRRGETQRMEQSGRAGRGTTVLLACLRTPSLAQCSVYWSGSILHVLD